MEATYPIDESIGTALIFLSGQVCYPFTLVKMDFIEIISQTSHTAERPLWETNTFYKKKGFLAYTLKVHKIEIFFASILKFVLFLY